MSNRYSNPLYLLFSKFTNQIPHAAGCNLLNEYVVGCNLLNKNPVLEPKGYQLPREKITMPILQSAPN